MSIRGCIAKTILSCIISLVILGIIAFFIPEFSGESSGFGNETKSFIHNKKSYKLNKYEYLIATSCILPPSNGNVLIGHDHVIEEISAIIEVKQHHDESIEYLEAPKGILLYGPPGTGKTTLAKSLASSIGKDCTLLSVSPDIVESKYYGESLKLLKSVFTLANKISPSVIFFDEIDGMLSRRNEMDQSHTTAMKTTFLTCIDCLDKDSILIGATNREKSLDPALLRRLSIHLKLDQPTIDDRGKMIRRFFSKLDHKDTEIVTSSFTRMSLSEIENFCKFCIRKCFTEGRRDETSRKDVSKLTSDDILKMFEIYKTYNISV